MKVITIANQKGGVGKTTTALNIGAILESKGYKVLYIDLDKQCNTSKTLKADITKKGVYELLKGADIKELIQVNAKEQNIISASERLSLIDLELSKEIAKEYKLKEGLEEIKIYFDYAILDTPPNLNTVTINALTSTDYLLVVANADIYSLEGINDLYSIVRSCQKYTNKDLKINGILLNRFNKRSRLNIDLEQILSDKAKEYGTKLYNTYIRECIAIKEAQLMGERINEYAPKSNATSDYKTLVNEILKDLEG